MAFYWPGCVPPGTGGGAVLLSPVGKAAGVRRNHQMAQAGNVLVVFGHTTSLGTAHLIQCVRALGKPVVVIDGAEHDTVGTTSHLPRAAMTS